MPRTATEHKSAYANHSNVAVERVTRQLRACGTTQSISIPPCLLRLSGRCSNNMLVTNVPRNPHQQLLILRTATFFRGSTQQPFKKNKMHALKFSVILEWCIFVELMILYICTCNHHTHFHYFEIRCYKSYRFFRTFFSKTTTKKLGGRCVFSCTEVLNRSERRRAWHWHPFKIVMWWRLSMHLSMCVQNQNDTTLVKL